MADASGMEAEQGLFGTTQEVNPHVAKRSLLPKVCPVVSLARAPLWGSAGAGAVPASARVGRQAGCDYAASRGVAGMALQALQHFATGSAVVQAGLHSLTVPFKLLYS